MDKRDACLSSLTLTAGNLIIRWLEKGKHWRQTLSSRTESLHLVLVLVPLFLERWLSHIDAALTFELSQPPLHTIISPLRPLVPIYVFDAGCPEVHSVHGTLELNGFPASPNVQKQLKADIKGNLEQMTSIFLNTLKPRLLPTGHMVTREQACASASYI